MHRRIHFLSANPVRLRKLHVSSLFVPTKLKLILLLLIGVGFAFFYFSHSPQVISEEVPVDQTITIQKLNITVDKLEITRQVNVNGTLYKAPNEKRFLIAHLFVQNQSDTVLNAALVRLFRLVDDKNRKFAPDLYNKITSVQPGATKGEQVGFVIRGDSSHFKLQIGDISGEKTTIEINIPKTK